MSKKGQRKNKKKTEKDTKCAASQPTEGAPSRAYKISYTPAAEKELAKVPKPYRTQLFERISKLKETPRPPGSKELEGYEGLHRVRQGDYRAIYTINDKDLLVMVVRIGDRKEVYRALASLI